jgi:recombination associated protein RdgC
MWFKQIQVFQLPEQKYSIEAISEKLEQLAFKPCLPSLPYSTGWASPVDEDDAPIVRMVNGYIMTCIQIEEKILPNIVITQALQDKVKKIEARDDRKVRQKEKLTLKDEITFTLLPRAFSKISRLYAFIDTRNHWLIIGSTNAAKNEQYLNLFKRSICEEVNSFDLIKPSAIFTHWLKTQDYPSLFGIEKAAVLQDPNQQKRVIRCQHQDLFAQSIQAFIKDGCEAKQIALSWHDRVNFVLAEDFTLRSIQYQEDILTQSKDVGETKQQRFDADVLIMTETLTSLFKDLLPLFMKKEPKEQKIAAKEQLEEAVI